MILKGLTVNMTMGEKNTAYFDLPLFFTMSKQFLAPRGLSAECVQVSAM